TRVSSLPRGGSANSFAIDDPVSEADKTRAANDVPKRDRHKVVEYPGYGDDGGVEAGRDLSHFGEQPRQWQEIHVGNAVLEAGCNEGRDRQYEANDFVGY